MKRVLMIGVVLAAVGGVLASPIPAENRKPAAFPAGHYILGGSWSGCPRRGCARIHQAIPVAFESICVERWSQADRSHLCG